MILRRLPFARCSLPGRLLAEHMAFAMALPPLNTLNISNTTNSSNTRICYVSSNRRSPKG